MLYKNIWKSAKKQGKEKMLGFGIKLSDLLAKVHINVRKKLLSSVIEAMGGKLKHGIQTGELREILLSSLVKKSGDEQKKKFRLPHFGKKKAEGEKDDK